MQPSELMPELMNAGTAAQFIGVCRKTLTNWNHKRIGPPRVLKGKRYWYPRDQIREWLKTSACATAHALAVQAGLPSASSLSQPLDPPLLPH
jgi:predicted site-specific integrase-resolvase